MNGYLSRRSMLKGVAAGAAAAMTVGISQRTDAADERNHAMRVCRYEHQDNICVGLYEDNTLLPIGAAAARCPDTAAMAEDLLENTTLLDLLVHGRHEQAARAIQEWAQRNPDACDGIRLPVSEVRLLRPIQTPGKMLLLAGNYGAHIAESGGVAPEREETFPYVFMKPATTFNDPDAPIPIPAVSPDHIDYECELGVIIGRPCKHVSEEEALDCVAGYTVVNDISDRQYKPFPNRKKRGKDDFFDWLHGKWHDGFCPMGPCATSAHGITDPQALNLTLRVNGEVRQDASTAQMIFPVAAIIAFIAQSVTLLPGDVIATGTPDGVGSASGQYLRPGDTLEAAITNIGVLRNTMA